MVIRLESTQIRWVSGWLVGRLDSINGGQRHSNGKVENNSRKPRELLKNLHRDSLKKSEVTLSQGMLKKGEVNFDADADDDEVRTSALQNPVTATLCTEEFFLSTLYTKLSPHISREMREGRNRQLS